METKLCINLADIHDAASRIAGRISETPLLESLALNKALGFRLLLKAEYRQVTGSFKARGAFNQVLQLTDGEKVRGIVAFSSGNHAQAVAYASRELGVAATILMPHDAPQIKIEKTRSYGAQIVTYNRNTEDRYVVGDKLLREHGGRLIHSYDDPRTVAGQGTVGLEIFKQTKELGIEPAAIVVNCCGGGLAAGVALTTDLYKNKPTLITAEPEDFDDARRSLESGRLIKNEKINGSICDALMMPVIGTDNFAVLQHYQARGLAASDENVESAMALAADHFEGIMLEPGGAAGLACACLNREKFRDQTVVVVASGGNVDAERYAGMVQHGRANYSKLLNRPAGVG
jgi:threonine dehydratase